MCHNSFIHVPWLMHTCAMTHAYMRHDSLTRITRTSLQHTATHCTTLQHTATHCNILQHTATHCNTLQHTATHLIKSNGHQIGDVSLILVTHTSLQHTATHCDTLQHEATHRNTPDQRQWPSNWRCLVCALSWCTCSWQHCISFFFSIFWIFQTVVVL